MSDRCNTRCSCTFVLFGMSGKRKKVPLSVLQKLDVCVDFEAMAPLSICTKYNIGKSTLYRIKASENKLRAIIGSESGNAGPVSATKP